MIVQSILHGRTLMQPDSRTVNEFLMAKFEALLSECDLVADNAAFGQTLDDMDEFFLTKGRQLLQETFQAKLQERIDHVEAAAEPPPCPKCKKKSLYQNLW
jgi:hypothetical protein